MQSRNNHSYVTKIMHSKTVAKQPKNISSYKETVFFSSAALILLRKNSKSACGSLKPGEKKNDISTSLSWDCRVTVAKPYFFSTLTSSKTQQSRTQALMWRFSTLKKSTLRWRHLQEGLIKFSLASHSLIHTPMLLSARILKTEKLITLTCFQLALGLPFVFN